MSKKRGVFTEEARRIAEEGFKAGWPIDQIKNTIEETTGRKYKAQQINGLKSVLLGHANGPKTEAMVGELPPTLSPAPPGVPPAPVPPRAPAPASLKVSKAAAGAPPEQFLAAQARVTVEYDIHRKDPHHGYIGRVRADANDPFGEKVLAEKFGDGLYDVQKLVNGVPAEIRRDMRVSGHGPPRFMNGMPAPAHGDSRLVHQNPYGAFGNNAYGQPGYGYQQGQPQPYGPTPVPHDPTSQFHNLFQVAKGMKDQMASKDDGHDYIQALQASYGFMNQVLEQQRGQQQASGSGTQDLFKQMMVIDSQREAREASRRDEERKDREKDRTHELSRIQKEAELREDRMKNEYDRQRARDKEDYDRRREMDKDYFSQARSLDRDRATEADKRVARVEEEAKAVGVAVQEELNEKVTLMEQKHKEINDIRKDGLDEQRRHNDQMHELKKESLDKQHGDGLVADVIRDVGGRITNTVDRMAMMRSVQELPEKDRPGIIRLLSGGQGNGNGNGNGHGGSNKKSESGDAGVGGGGDMVEQLGKASIDKILESPFFREQLQPEWSLHIQSKRGPYMFCRTFLGWMNTSQNMLLFGNFMIVRTWEKMQEVMGPHLDPEVAKVFQTKEAEEFYIKFTDLLNDNIRLSVEIAGQRLNQAQQQPTGSPIS